MPSKPPVPKSCEPSPELPALDSRFAPALSGGVTLVAARGDARLSTSGALASWSADGTQIAIADDAGAVTIWRSSDGTLVDLIVCPGGPVGASAFAVSADERWLAISGNQRDGRGEHPVTCLVDRSAHQARIIAGAARDLQFDGTTLVGRDRTINFVTGTTTMHPPPPTPPTPPTPPAPTGRINTEGADRFAVSHNGRYLAGWTTFQGVELDQRVPFDRDDTTARPARPTFLAVWDLVTEKRLWRDTTRCCWGWQFSPDDRFLENSATSNELLRVASGAPLSFPGPLLPVAPDGERVLVHRPRGLELWSIEPPKPLVSLPRPRTVVARSRDGAVSVALDPEHVIIERAGTCTELDIAAARRDALALSPDGRELYVGIDQSLRPPGAVIRNGKVLRTVLTSGLMLWQTETVELTSSISVIGPAAVYPIPSVGHVGFGVEDGVWIYDARTGRLVTVAAPPRVRQSAPDAQGTSRPVRDLDGDNPDTLSGPVAAFSDGKHLVGHSRGARMSIWDLEDPRRVQDLPEVPNASWQEVVALAPHERHLAAGMRNGVIGLWTRDGAALPVTAMHDAWIDHLAFSPDGRVLASSARDGIVLLTSATTGAPVGKIALTADHATFLWWSPDSAGLVIDTARGFQITVRRHQGCDAVQHVDRGILRLLHRKRPPDRRRHRCASRARRGPLLR